MMAMVLAMEKQTNSKDKQCRRPWGLSGMSSECYLYAKIFWHPNQPGLTTYSETLHYWKLQKPGFSIITRPAIRVHPSWETFVLLRHTAVCPNQWHGRFSTFPCPGDENWLPHDHSPSHAVPSHLILIFKKIWKNKRSLWVPL